MTTHTGSAVRAASVAITSSASKSGCDAVATPSAGSSASMAATCASIPSGVSSEPSGRARSALYPPIRSVRHAGRQLPSRQHTSSVGEKRLTSVDRPSKKPRTAPDRAPSGALIEEGRP